MPSLRRMEINANTCQARGYYVWKQFYEDVRDLLEEERKFVQDISWLTELQHTGPIARYIEQGQRDVIWNEFQDLEALVKTRARAS